MMPGFASPFAVTQASTGGITAASHWLSQAESGKRAACLNSLAWQSAQSTAAKREPGTAAHLCEILI